MLDLKNYCIGVMKKILINLINGIRELNGLKNGEPLIFFSRLG